MSGNRETLFIGIVLVAAFVAVYFFFGDSLPFVPAIGESQIDAEYAGVIAEAARLKGITLDIEIVKSDKFTRLLIPAPPPLPGVKPGGRNPYLPL
ncbi:MAG: hypothetical protein A2131_00940 [Candidatus Sungbacteria bacterium GWC2_49_10]|uniref:Uncharacterized protein n=1 Tax=Candidatus Sungbacteria bacterium GWC2_49_10 TaxID=1802263 RepID=A0A1G2K2X8_9BACT|nr:MAG: hypothetical protein A2131_00940 [Candidatus Sungbacteria bacterium GWC2_49_10]